MSRTRQFFWVFIALLVLAFAVSACSGDDDDDDDATPTTSPSASVTASAAATSTPEVTQEPPTEAPPTEAAPTQTPEPTETPEPTPDTDPSDAAVTAASEALATWLGPVGDPASITVDSVTEMTWSNGCLDLARPGQLCTQALVDGYRIMLGLGNATYEVRTDADGSVALWAPQVQILAKFQEAQTNAFLFTTDDGGSIAAQPVFGTLYGVEAGDLSVGDPVGLGLAEAPQREGFLLVWLDPAQ